MAEIQVKKDTFEQEVLQADKPVLVDFWASWCGPCMMLAPTVAEIAEEFADQVKVCKINVDDEPELAAKFGISSIPTLMLFRNGKVEKITVGVRPKDEIVGLFA